MRLSFLFLASIFLAGCVITGPDFVSPSTVILAGQTVKVTLASTPEQLAKGLAGVKNLDWDQGMLFIFPRRDYYNFWMKDMLIPLDIIWIDGNKVVEISKNVLPPVDLAQQANLPIYQGSQPVDYVLEVKAGFSDKFGLEVGQTVDINR